MPASTIENDNPATVVISHTVKEGLHQDYEAWLKEILPIAKASSGHLGVSVIRPVAGATTTYTVIIRYDTRENLIHWMNSEARKKLINKVQPLLVHKDKFEVKSGLDFWFTPEGAKAKLPKRWKQFLITWSAIFPLVACMSYALNAITAYMQMSVQPIPRIALLTFFVVLLMVYVVMPRYTKLVHKWLFN